MTKNRFANVTPEIITELKPNEIFVFGSNTAGRHGKGAAKDAMKWGAKIGQGFGLMGNTFGIPTKDNKIKTLPLLAIQRYVQMFVASVKESKIKDPFYLITPIGCGLAGYKPEQIAPFFQPIQEYPNVYLPLSFREVLSII